MANDRRKKGVPADPYVDEVKNVRTALFGTAFLRNIPHQCRGHCSDG